MACTLSYQDDTWYTFSLDWSNMSWDFATKESLESTAFFISGERSMTTPLIDVNMAFVEPPFIRN